MDFAFNESQEALRELTARIAADVCTDEHLTAIAATDTGYDPELWKQLCGAGLVGISVPESLGGGGLGWLESAVVLAELARASAPVPGLQTMALCLPALVEHAPEVAAQVVAGHVTISAAMHEAGGDPFVPRLQVENSALHGTKTCVGFGMSADWFLVTAVDGLWLVAGDASGVSRRSQTNSTDVPDAMVTFDAAQAVCVGDTSATRAMLMRGISAAAVMTAAVCEAALALTAAYAVERHQFDKPIASFQAVSQRAGDAYIDTEAARLTAWQAAFLLADRSEITAEVAAALFTAKFWASEGGWRVLHAALHVHGGVGVDRDYPLHRHFLLHKQLELHLGSATPSLVALGAVLAD